MSNEFSDPYPIDKHESPSSSDATSARRYEELLLAATHPKKRAGRRIFKETRHPIYRGVRKRNNDKWVCELREPNKKTRLWLGTYPTPEMAARAHDVAALALRGKSSCLNFADSASRLPVPVSVEAEDIRRAAHEAAELFRPPEIGGEVGETSNINGGDDDDKGSSWSSSAWKQENEGYIDEEAVFDMPGLLANMAEGLLLSPPHYAGDDDLDADIDVSLWNYPF